MTYCKLYLANGRVLYRELSAVIVNELEGSTEPPAVAYVQLATDKDPRRLERTTDIYNGALVYREVSQRGGD